MHGKGLFHAYAVCDASDSECLGDAAAFFGNHGTLKELNALARTLFDLVINAHVVPNLNRGNILLELLICKSANLIHLKDPP